MLYKKSGLLGISGVSNDMRDLLGEHRAGRAPGRRLLRLSRGEGDRRARGHHSRDRRAGVHRRHRRALGRRSAGASATRRPGSASSSIWRPTRVTARGFPCPQSRVSAWVIPTNEELMIARHTGHAAGAGPESVLTVSEEDMASRRRITVDGNEAAASVAYRASESIAIYPITPSSNDGRAVRRVGEPAGAKPLGRDPGGGRDAVGRRAPRAPCTARCRPGRWRRRSRRRRACC